MNALNKQEGNSSNKRKLNESNRDSIIASFIQTLITWFTEEGRDLPWRHTRNPYKILVSEIMLQQTNVEVVTPIYEKFLKKFPSIQKLANSSLIEVQKITDQLGYKRRGEYLHNIAKTIVLDRKGIFPTTLDELLALKGIGRYTAGAILSFAFEVADKTAAIVDVNVERVLDRIFGLWEWERNSAFDKEIWKLSEKIVILSSKNVWNVNQGILDLGALICVAGKPKCPSCPMMDICEYYKIEVPKVIPLDSFFP